MGKGANIKTIKFWQSKIKAIAAKIAFIAQYYTKKFFFKLRARAPQLKKVHLNAFPAIHFKAMDGYDYSLKFSSELLVLSIAIITALLNFYFFSGNQVKSYSDGSLAAKFLSYHPGLNEKLYAKNTSIITTVADGNFIFAQAQAEDFAGLDTQNINAAEEDSQNYVISDGALVKPSPDSIQSLLDKQIKIYETKPGDTLKSIAAANGISTKTIMWANKLTSEQIKPGWQLVILPVDGVLHKASSNDTLPDVAKKYSADIAKIMSYNMLESEEDIEPGQLLIVPGGTMPAPPTPKPVKPKAKAGKPGTTEPTYHYDGTGHIFPWGYCTWYVATRVHVPWGGNAKNWLANAKSFGAVISSEPAVGAIVVTNDNRKYGHVALVEKVEDDRFLISEMNYKGKGIISQRWISTDNRTVRGFIYH